MTNINALICELEAESSTTKTQKILQGLKQDPIAQEIFRLALDPYITFGIKASDLPACYATNDPHFDWDAVQSFTARLANREVTGNKARKSVDEWLRRSEGAVIARILNKDLRCGVQAATVNKVIPGLIPEFKVALAAEGIVILDGKLDKGKKPKFPILAEPKLDGFRGIAVKRDGDFQLTSREGIIYPGFTTLRAVLQERMPDNTMFDGEIAGDTFKRVSECARNPDADDTMLHFRLFDTMSSREFDAGKSEQVQSVRSELARKRASKFGSTRLKPITGVIVHTWEDLLAEFDKQRGAGYEGLVIKQLDAPYSFKRSAVWNKVKAFFTVDGVVVGFEEGTGKHEGKLGRLQVEVDGVVTGVGSGFTDQEREVIWFNRKKYIGKWVEFKAQEKTEDAKYRFPSFLRWRTDRD